MIKDDSSLRCRLISRQRQRVAEFSPERIADDFHQIVRRIEAL
jgi:hypothetical protein